MKIVAITDKPGSAIDRLARMNEARLPHLRYTVCTLHPKRASAKEIETLQDALRDADLVDVQYWKSGVVARQILRKGDVGRWAEIPWVLTHQNEHNIHDTRKDHWAWKDEQWAAHVCKNGWQKAELKAEGIDATLIPHAIEFSNFEYAEKMPEEKVVGYVGQMKRVKGVREIAQACKELGYKLFLVGSVSESEYMADVLAKYGDVIQTLYPSSLFVPDNALKTAYAKMRIYCANSDDGTESGTMPILEAMLSGVPVVTRNIGLVRDVGKHGKTMWVREGRYDDVEDLKAALKTVMEAADVSDRMRQEAWRAVRQYHPDRQAREYEILFRKVLYPGVKPVSVIMPTAGRKEQVLANIAKLADQTYKNFEAVVCDDNTMMESVELAEHLKELAKRVHFPIRHVWTGKVGAGYGLAKARNMGIIEATGEILVFCDDRLVMHPGAIEAFVKALGASPEKRWLWGSKGVFKTFVENFSCTWRRSLINGGMFNERIDCYGGMTQEVSSRFGAQGFKFDFCPQALAEASFGTHSVSKHRDDVIRVKVRLYKMGFQ